MNEDNITFRNAMLDNFGKMLRPARMIINMQRSELAKMSGLSEELINEIETGERPLEQEHYLAIASVFDNAGYHEDRNIYEALVRILIPENSFDEYAKDFILIRKWFETLNAVEKMYQDDNALGTTWENTDFAKITSQYKIFADTSAVEDENFSALMNKLEPFLKENNAAIIIPQTVINDLNDDYVAAEDEEDELSIKEIIEYIDDYKTDGLIVIRGNDSGANTYEALSEVFDNLKDEYRFMLVTQDIEQAKFVNDNNSSRKNPVIVAYIDDDAELSIWDFHDE